MIQRLPVYHDVTNATGGCHNARCGEWGDFIGVILFFFGIFLCFQKSISWFSMFRVPQNCLCSPILSICRILIPCSPEINGLVASWMSLWWEGIILNDSLRLWVRIIYVPWKIKLSFWRHHLCRPKHDKIISILIIVHDSVWNYCWSNQIKARIKTRNGSETKRNAKKWNVTKSNAIKLFYIAILPVCLF